MVFLGPHCLFFRDSICPIFWRLSSHSILCRGINSCRVVKVTISKKAYGVKSVICQWFITYTSYGLTYHFSYFVCSIETVGENKKAFTGGVFNGGWNFGSLCMVGLAYLIRSWSYLQITFASIALLLLGSKLINDTTLRIGNWRPDNFQTDEDIRPLICRQKYRAKFLWKTKL